MRSRGRGALEPRGDDGGTKSRGSDPARAESSKPGPPGGHVIALKRPRLFAARRSAHHFKLTPPSGSCFHAVGDNCPPCGNRVYLNQLKIHARFHGYTCPNLNVAGHTFCTQQRRRGKCEGRKRRLGALRRSSGGASLSFFSPSIGIEVN